MTCASRALALAVLLVSPAACVTIVVGGADPWADTVITYDPGRNAADGFTDPTTAIGEPERFTGEGIFPSVVSPFNPPFGIEEIVSIGGGGQLVLAFDEPVLDDPNNPFGIDLLIFGNTGFIDAAWPNGVVDGMFGNDGGTIEISPDGENWTAVPKLVADGLWPTVGYLDSGPYDELPGSLTTEFTHPLNPQLTFDDVLGLDYAELLGLYDGSGGGIGIDLGMLGLEAISFVRISVSMDAPTNAEVDAISDVAPMFEPADLDQDGLVNGSDLLLLLGAWGPCDSCDDCAADLDADCVVGPSDLIILLGSWS